jgi:hypothetical protein
MTEIRRVDEAKQELENALFNQIKIVQMYYQTNEWGKMWDALQSFHILCPPCVRALNVDREFTITQAKLGCLKEIVYEKYPTIWGRRVYLGIFRTRFFKLHNMPLLNTVITDLFSQGYLETYRKARANNMDNDLAKEYGFAGE